MTYVYIKEIRQYLRLFYEDNRKDKHERRFKKGQKVRIIIGPYKKRRNTDRSGAADRYSDSNGPGVVSNSDIRETRTNRAAK